jgi:hypothetical protein
MAALGGTGSLVGVVYGFMNRDLEIAAAAGAGVLPVIGAAISASWAFVIHGGGVPGRLREIWRGDDDGSPPSDDGAVALTPAYMGQA